MRKLLLGSTLLLPLALAAPAFSQGSMMSPPSPNASNSMPENPNSAPPGARTMPPGTTGIGRMGAVATTNYGTPHRRRRMAHRRRPTNPDAAEGRTVPVPQSQ